WCAVRCRLIPWLPKPASPSRSSRYLPGCWRTCSGACPYPIMQQEADRARCFTRRALFLGGAQMAIFGALGARLYHLQVERGADFALLAEDNRANQRLLVPPRGRIVDRLGRPLARNVPTYRMLVIREQAGDLRSLLARLGDLVTLAPDRIDAVLEESRARR